ncbi:MAG: hypothetical protein JWM44_4476 [Bacilli bacterium]|nr:hypothetical protein [Bacilli bacterium]
MIQYTADLPITVDLNVVAKYHMVTKLKVDRLTQQDIPTNNFTDTLKVLAIKNDEYGLHPAFDYWKYAADAGLTEPKANNLLYLLYVNCLYEWRFYSESLITTAPSRDLLLKSETTEEFNLVLHAREELIKIRNLCLLLESHLNETELKFDYISNTKRTKEAKRDKHKVLGVKFTDTSIIKSVLQYTISQLFDNARTENNDILRAILIDKSPNYHTIDDILRHLHIPPSSSGNAVHSFRKYLIDIFISFMDIEANIVVDKKSIPTPEALIIYSLFSLLGLIKTELIENHFNNAIRANYISNMSYNVGNIQKKKKGNGKSSGDQSYSFSDISFEPFD